MFKPFSVFVGLRYSLTRKRSLFLSFVSLISMLGISLGVMILIVALSVMNGSIDTLRGEALKSVPHVTLSGPAVADWETLVQRADNDPRILAAAPFLEGEATLQYQGQTQFLRLRGVVPALEAEVVNEPLGFQRDVLNDLAQQGDGIVLSTQLAGRLRIFRGDEVSAISLDNLLGRSLQEGRGFQVVGFADFGIYATDNIALINLEPATAFFTDAPGVEPVLRLRVDDLFAAREIAEDVYGDMEGIEIRPWYEIQASLFNALNMEKIITTFMLLMIVIIGAVNIVSTLVMVVSDKGADIAILRTMGASRKTVMSVFVVQGMIAGIIGTLLGAGLGLWLAQNVSGISLWLERMINSVMQDGNVYLISHLQTQTDGTEVLLICVAALLISFLATLYPAYRASRVQPAEVLRYE